MIVSAFAIGSPSFLSVCSYAFSGLRSSWILMTSESPGGVVIPQDYARLTDLGKLPRLTNQDTSSIVSSAAAKRVQSS